MTRVVKDRIQKLQKNLSKSIIVHEGLIWQLNAEIEFPC